MLLGYPTSTSFLPVDDWSTDPRVLGCHNIYDWEHFGGGRHIDAEEFDL